jgi:transcriptional regulator with XRE-family HTH domain
MEASPGLSSCKIINMTVGEKIKKLRRERGWSQGELGEKVGMPAQNISRYEKNKAAPRESTLAVFAEAFGLPVSEFTSLAAPLDVPNLDPEIAELMRLIPTLEENDQFVIKRVLKALINEKKVKKLLAS